MVSPDFVTQPVYGAVQAEAAAMSVAGVGDYGALSTPVHAGPGWGLRMVRPAAGQDAPIVPLLVAQESYGHTDHHLPGHRPGSATRPAGGQRASRSAAHLRHHRRRDGQCRRELAARRSRPALYRRPAKRPDGAHRRASSHLAAPPAAAARTVAVATGLGKERVPEVHTAQLRVSAPGAAIGGFTIASERSYLAFGVVTGLLLLALIGDGLWLRRTRGTPGT